MFNTKETRVETKNKLMDIQVCCKTPTNSGEPATGSDVPSPYIYESILLVSPEMAFREIKFSDWIHEIS